MKKSGKKLNQSGSSMILVIVAIAFIGIICGLVLTMTMTNVQMKATDESSKANFYDDETVVNEVTAKLEEYSSSCMKTAYAWLIKNYSSTTLDTAARQKEFAQKYMEGLSQKLQNQSATSGLQTTYDASLLKDAVLTDSSLVDVKAANGTNTGTIKHSTDADGNYDYQYLTLEDVMITYTDSQDFETTITTDINMELPESGGADTTFAKYALISDRLIKVTANNIVTGGVYAGGYPSSSSGITTEGGGDNINENYGGIWTDTEAGQLTINGNGNNVVTRQSIIASNRAKIAIKDAKVWSKNILTIGDSGSDSNRVPSISINGVTKVEDDLTVKADYSNIVLEKEYYGYSYQNKDKTTNKSSAETSSALNVNAQNVQINLENLSKFILCGRSFISSKQGDLFNAADEAMDDILTGQSITAKNDQSIYLVPTDKCLKISSNPIDYDSLEQYVEKKLGSSKTYEDLDLSGYDNDIVDFSKSPASTVWAYLDQSAPIKAIYYEQGTGTSANKMVNYYYNFESEEKANEYVAYYYSKHKSEMTEIFNKFYGGTQLTIDPTGLNRFEIAGTGLVKQNGSLVLKTAATSDLTSMSNQYKEQYKSVQLNLRENGNTTKDVESNEYVDSIVNLANVNSLPLSYPGSDTDVSTKFIVTNEADYTIKNDGKGIIIASGNVELDKSVTWEGVIIADGRISLNKEGTFIANESLVLDVLNYCQDKIDLGKYLYAYDSSVVGRAGDNTINYGNAISFEDWKKN